jgi:hypothetical protein
MSITWLTRGLSVLILFSVLNNCTYQKTHSRSKLEKPPIPVAVKPNTAAVDRETSLPAKVKPNTAAVDRETSLPAKVKPKTAAVRRQTSLPAKVKSETTAVVPESSSEVVSPPPIPEPRFYLHRVRWKKETLFIIAKWYTGSGENWKALSNANPKLNPNRIFINTNIFIPEDLMKYSKPMPLSFLSSFIRKKSVQSFQSNKPSNENDVTEMFGPIEANLPSMESGKVELFGPIENDLDFFDSEAIELFKPVE